MSQTKKDLPASRVPNRRFLAFT